MLKIQTLRDNKDEILRLLSVKNFNDHELIDKVLALDTERRDTQRRLDDTLAESKRLSKTIGQLIGQGKNEEAEEAKKKTTEMKQFSGELQEKLSRINSEQEELMLDIPNVPHESVPPGDTDEDNELIRKGGPTAQADEKAKPHWEIARDLDIIDFDLGVKITGSGFPVYKKKAAKLQRAFESYFLDVAINEGYTEVQPPLLVNEASGYGTGQLPDKDGQMYSLADDNYYLIPTAEVPVTNMYRDMILNEDQLPVKNAAFSACFRREAGSYGKDVRGLNRLHQFDKVEIVQVVHPENSYKILEEMTEYVLRLIETLGMPYRVLKLCGGDTGFASALTYDVEVFSAAQNRWLEVSSISNFESFQANRMNLRFKNKEGKKQPPHTLNGSALAFPRILAALLENNQHNGKIKIPDVLVNYTGFEYIEP